MSKQPAASRARVRLLRQELAQPGDPRQMWLLVRMDPMDNNRGEFFVTHGRNFEKFESRKGFTVIAHSYDRVALTMAARKATQAGGDAYQPKFSAARPENQRAEPSQNEAEPAMPDPFLLGDDDSPPTTGEVLDHIDLDDDLFDT